MNLQTMLDAFMAKEALKRSASQMTLGELVSALKACPQNAEVVTSDGGTLGEPISYRGYYEDLAFKKSHETKRTVADVLKDASSAIGESFYGYKGGEYTMHKATPLWSSGYGDASGDRLMSCEMKDGKVLVILAKEED